MLEVIKTGVREFIEDDCATMAAALAYYTVFSLPPLLALLVALAGGIFGAEAVQGAVEQHAGLLIGQGAATEVRTMMQQAQQQGNSTWWKALLGLGILLFGATTAFAQLQAALNRVWEVKPDPKQGGLRAFVGKRLLSFGFVLLLGALLFASTVVTTAVTALGEGPFVEGIHFVISLLVVSIGFGAMFKYLPDVKVQWSDVGIGAIVTGLLFVIGKLLLGVYLGASNPGRAFGTADSIILIFVWIYYSAMLVLLGAEITQAWACLRRGKHQIEPEPGAIPISTPGLS